MPSGRLSTWTGGTYASKFGLKSTWQQGRPVQLVHRCPGLAEATHMGLRQAEPDQHCDVKEEAHLAC